MDAPKTKKRGRPKKEETKEEILQIEPLQTGQIADIRHVFRVLSLDGQFHEEGAQPATVVEDYLKQNYLGQGWELYQISQVRVVSGSEGHILGQEMLYVFVKYAQ
jgi:hypothetical protein